MRAPSPRGGSPARRSGPARVPAARRTPAGAPAVRRARTPRRTPDQLPATSASPPVRAIRRAVLAQGTLARRVVARGPLLAPALLAAMVAFLWLPTAPGIGPQPTRLWRGYQTLAMRADIVRARGPVAFASRLGAGVVSDVTAKADFWDFGSVTRVPYAALDNRLDRLDPRRDRYIEGAAGYFHAVGAGRDWWVAYIPAVRTGLRSWLRLAATLGVPWQGQWRLAEFDPFEKLLSLLAVFAFAVLLALSLEEFRRAAVLLAALTSLIWTPFLLSGGIAQLAVCLIVLLSWFPLLRACLQLRAWDGHLLRALRRPLRLFACVAVAALATSSLGSGFSFSRLLFFLSPLAGSLLLLALIPAFSLLATAGWGRRNVFQPVPIVRPQADPFRGRSASAYFAPLALVFIALLSLTRGFGLPTPRVVLGARDFSWQSLGRLARVNTEPRLPGFAELVTHAAFQETMAFGRPWKTPRRDERVVVREYVSNDAADALVARLRTVKVFDTVWLRGIGRRAEPGSLESLLYAQERPVSVSIRGAGYDLLKELPIVLLVLSALLAWLGRDLGLGPLIRGNLLRLNGAARRDQVP
jgi:hypothetical protein